MRIAQVVNFYPAYVARFYEQHPGLDERSYDEQLAALLADGFTAAHLFAPELKRAGCDAHLIICNCEQLQRAWARENGVELGQTSWWFDVTRRQVDILRPDVLHISEPISLDSRFIRALQHRPYLVTGWRAAAILPWVDLTEFDVILSNEDTIATLARKHGARATEYFLPGFPEWIAEKVRDESKVYDLVFCGQLTLEHKRRVELMERLSAHATATGDFRPAFFVGVESQASLLATRPYVYPSRWGMEFYREIKRGKVGFNNVIDFAKGEAGNMRQFEVTGSGTMLLTEFNPNLSKHFEVGREVESYASFEELVEKVKYYVTHDAEREEIARRGQERCLRDHGMVQRCKELVDIFSKYVGSSVSVNKATQSPSLGELLHQTAVLLNAEQPHESYYVALQALTLYPRERHVNYLLGVILVKMQRLGEAYEALMRETRFHPDHTEAKTLKEQVGQVLLQASA